MHDEVSDILPFWQFAAVRSGRVEANHQCAALECGHYVCGHDAKAVTGTNKQMGKGATPQQSEASAVMELAERFSFFSFCKQADNFFTGTYNNLKEKKKLSKRSKNAPPKLKK